MKIRNMLIGAMMVLGVSAQAQSSFVSVGSDATGEGGSVSFSVGQVVYSSTDNGMYSISEGVQQAYIIKDYTPSNVPVVNIQLSAYPNPTSDVLHLVVDDIDATTLTYVISDVNARTQAKGTLLGADTEIPFAQFLAGVYFVEVKKDGKMVKQFQVVKN